MTDNESQRMVLLNMYQNNANNISSQSGWKMGLKIKNEIEGFDQWVLKLVGILIVLRWIWGSNLEIITWIGGELWHGQAQNRVNFDFRVWFDLEGKDQSTPKATRILTTVFVPDGPNLMILACTGN